MAHWRRFPVASAHNVCAGSGRFTHLTYSLLVPAPVLLHELSDAFHLLVPASLKTFSHPPVIAEGHPKTVGLEEAAVRLLAEARTWPNNPALRPEFVVDVIASSRYYDRDVSQLRSCRLPDGVDLALLSRRHGELLAQQAVH